MMNDKVKKVFELLGVEPNEEFKIEHQNGAKIVNKYRINENLFAETWVENEKAWFNSSELITIEILLGNIKIIKIPKLTEQDKTAIKYLRDGDMRYVAREKGERLWASKGKPLKRKGMWLWNQRIYEIPENLFRFVKWTDDEPFDIESVEVE